MLNNSTTSALNNNVAVKPNFNGIPPDLKAIPNWLLWKLLPSKKPGGKPRKFPCRVDGSACKWTDPQNWASFDAVKAAYERGGYSLDLLHRRLLRKGAHVILWRVSVDLGRSNSLAKPRMLTSSTARRLSISARRGSRQMEHWRLML